MSANNFERIKKAIELILEYAPQQPGLEEIALHLDLSSSHFHRLFTEHVGITPQQFLHAINIHHAKKLLSQNQDILSSALDVGLSGSGRLHDQFVSIEAVSPGEFKSKGRGIEFYWGNAESPYGSCFISWTKRGIHRLAFSEDATRELQNLKESWPSAIFEESQKDAATKLHQLFHQKDLAQNLWVTGTNFQVNVWRALLSIPEGNLSTYSAIAKSIGDKNAQRAVGSAIGKNPIAYLIPCHRVIRSTGVLNNYRWEPWRKALMLGTEISKNEIKEK